MKYSPLFPLMLILAACQPVAEPFTPIQRHITEQERSELKAKVQEAADMYRGCVAHHARQFSSSDESATVVAVAAVAKCGKEKSELQMQDFNMIYRSRPNNSITEARCKEIARKFANDLEALVQKQIVGYIIELRSGTLQ